MLRKLLKYDLRASLRIFLFVWPTLLVLALLNRLALFSPLEGNLWEFLTSLTLILHIFAMLAADLAAFIIAIVRFYRGLLREEGYLMFTLPVRPWQLLLSKLLTALLCELGTLLVSLLSLVILLVANPDVQEFIRYVSPDSADVINAGTVVLLVLTTIASVAAGLQQIYMSLAVGHLARKHRILLAVLFYYGLNVVYRSVSATLSTIGASRLTTTDFDVLFAYLDTHPPVQLVNASLGISLAIMLIGNLIYFFVTELILRKNLNLE